MSELLQAAGCFCEDANHIGTSLQLHLLLLACCQKRDWSVFLSRYDDLANYRNERSLFLAEIREDIEEAWYSWEVQQHVNEAALRQMTPEQVSHLAHCGFACAFSGRWN